MEERACEREGRQAPGEHRWGVRAGHWLREHRVELGFAVLVGVMMFMRGYWAPDEPDFAQCVKEMRARGEWLLPYLNGQPYTEKPILFYWLMKVAAIVADRLTGGAGVVLGITAWAVRLPSVLASIGFVFAFRRWAARFLDPSTARYAVLVLVTTPLWIWQAQFIQIDMVFAALLAWSWLAWASGWLILRGQAPGLRAGEEGRWFNQAYACLALAVLAKGPLALVLSAALALAFLTLQRDLRALGRVKLLRGAVWLVVLVCPWYLAAGLRGGASYAKAMIIHQNLDRAVQAWDHLQPWWKYVSYIAGDFFPWVLPLVPASILLWRLRARLRPVERFLALGFLVPLVLLSLSQSKQGKYLLMGYPFLALVLGMGFRRFEEAPRDPTGRNLKRALAAGLGLPFLALAAVGFGRAGGHHLQAQVGPFLGLMRLGAVLFVLGLAALARTWRAPWGLGPVKAAAGTLAAFYLALGTWGFHRLDPLKDYRDWHARTEATLAGREAFFWGEIRSGAMIYSDRFLPEIRTRQGLAALPVGTLLVTPQKRWRMGFEGLEASDMASFEEVCQQSQGGDGLILLRRR